MEELKHECGVAMIRLKKPLHYYKEKYGTELYGLNKLYLLMEKQRNRGQEGAGIACVKLSAKAGEEFLSRERCEGKNAISDLFSSVYSQIDDFTGECYMGHLRYSTTGRSGISYVHPMLRRQNYRHNTFALCGNFNLTNVDEVFQQLVSEGQHPRRTSDTTVLLEQLGSRLDGEPEGENRIVNLLKKSAPLWDGGYVICGEVGSGDMFAIRDPWGIRSAFYYCDDEVVIVASERAVIQTVMNVNVEDIHEIERAHALIIDRKGETKVAQILEQEECNACSFERIYFSRGSDVDIYKERKALGAAVVPAIMRSIGSDLKNSVFSFIPNTAEVAFYGMCEELKLAYNKQVLEKIEHGAPIEEIASLLSSQIRHEKVAIKDVKFRTFISESATRCELANHVYDITYGTICEEKDNLIVIDDSIVRGTTLKQSIISILSRLKPKKLVVVSSAPQIRYPDFYGIDMSDIGDLVAFRAAVDLNGEEKLKDIYNKCIAQRGSDNLKNYVNELYDHLTDEEISAKIAEFVTPKEINFEVDIIFQKLDEMHRQIPNHSGDWYFSGDYPTRGGIKALNESFIKYYESTYLNK